MADKIVESQWQNAISPQRYHTCRDLYHLAQRVRSHPARELVKMSAMFAAVSATGEIPAGVTLKNDAQRRDYRKLAAMLGILDDLLSACIATDKA